MCLYVLSSVLWCPLRFPHKNDVRFVFTSSCLQEDSCLIYVICVCLSHSSVQHILCCVFYFFLSSSGILCTKCCQFLWIIHCWLHFRFSLTVTYIIIVMLRNDNCVVVFCLSTFCVLCAQCCQCLLCLVCPMLPVSPDCPFVISP